MDRAGLAAAINRVASLRGTFVLRSGRRATEYFDKYRFEADPVLLAAIAEHAAPLIPPNTQVLAGLELGGVPVATALSLHCGLPVVFVRKTAKDYGTCQLAEGLDVTGRRLLIVEDVITSGGQVARSTAQLRELGAVVTDAVCVIDREEGGLAALADQDVAVRALFTATELRASGED
jgi:orotate phosphoribosyltransferase